ncbi:hypothetical protein JR316_0003474 [Psilocybe cubensis]|uniref:Uncharacterized protein n=2 Tax=Psilocybe cubensis TaxID=181762 RepID=A0ACB8H7V6_PSICU|nr:hypothetical protein JR316_0003474 [Psilocybe cubensis]KAH9483996.1 hypothetical protein JR316_0003474 [Psilocybe cubensis]
MTEYDFSPEAFEAHIRKQQQIARWVDKTNLLAPSLRNPFTPATPAVRALKLHDNSDDHPTTHRRHASSDDRDRRRTRDSDRDRDRGRERERDRDRGRDRDREQHYHSDSPSRPHTATKRHRSASHSQPARPEPTRNYTVPPPLPLNTSPVAQYPPPTTYPQNPYAPRVASPRDSRHSSRSSSTQVPSPTSYFPPQQPPWSAPAAYKSMPTPTRSQTAPHYYPQDAKYPSTPPYYQNPSYVYPAGSPVKAVEYDVRPFSPSTRAHLLTPSQNVPQYPFSAYQIKQPPLLKRIFMGLTGGNKQHHQQRKVPRRKRSTSF